MSRPETGPMVFGDDWAGVFIRGDEALIGFLPQLLAAIQKLTPNDLTGDRESTLEEQLMLGSLHGLAQVLASANHHVAQSDPTLQRFKAYESCLVT